jgi:hypothetical protein
VFITKCPRCDRNLSPCCFKRRDSFQSFLKSTIGSLSALQETGTEISSRVRKYLDKYMKGKSSDLDQLTPKQLVEVVGGSDVELLI